MRGEVEDLELQRAEAEGQLQQLQEVRARVGPSVPRMLRPSGWGGDLSTYHSLIPNPGPASREEEPPTTRTARE